DTALADRSNLAFAGTLVTNGSGEAVVWATGDRTENGNIARLIATSVDTSTPLTRKIADFSHLILWIVLGLAAVTFIVGVARGERGADMFMASVALAVGAIPEGLPAAVTIVLAIGVSRMATRGVIIRKLPAVETLGSTTVICTDKTGTLTQNQMTVRKIVAGGHRFDVSGSGYEPAGTISLDGAVADIDAHVALRETLLGGLLCNESRWELESGGRPAIQGDPTEAAMLIAAYKAGLDQQASKATRPRLDMIPFDSAQMFRATLHEASPSRVVYKVGAVERLLERCTDALADDGSLVPLDRDDVRREVEAMAREGLRVLGLARRHLGPDHRRLEHAHVRGGLTWLGLQGMIDPPRPEAIEAVRSCLEAGIAVKMITGDHLVTARAIATKIGLRLSSADAAVNGGDAYTG
ncbi:MAG: HAD family hydrolase, partial [Sphingomonadales bacterium]